MIGYTESNHLTFKKLFAAYGVYMALLILLIVASFITPDLFDEETLAVLFRQSAQLGIIAIGQTMVMLVAGLDLSCLLYTSPSPRDATLSRMPSSA